MKGPTSPFIDHFSLIEAIVRFVCTEEGTERAGMVGTTDESLSQVRHWRGQRT